MDPLTIGAAIGTSLITSFATKGDSEPIKTLNDIWYLAFGKMGLFVEQKRVKHQHLLESYKNELVQAVSAIPEHNLIEPPLSIVGPALEASRFYIEEDALRKMFAKLVAASMDNRKSSIAHQAFIEIIKQLSPFDAQNLVLFTTNTRLPLVNYCIEKNQNNRVVATSSVFLSNPDNDDIRTNSSSIINLQRLGLVTFRFDHHFKDKQVYEIFKTHPYFNILMEELESSGIYNDSLKPKMFIDEGMIELSPFGSDFISVCL